MTLYHQFLVNAIHDQVIKIDLHMQQVRRSKTFQKFKMKDTFRRPIDWNHGYAFMKHGTGVRREIEDVFTLAGARIIVNAAVQLCQRAELEKIPKERCGNA